MVPEGESPLLLPANKHKQLVVIDFEYANANLPGLEFANHFVSQSSASSISFDISFNHYYIDPDTSSRPNGRTTTTTLSTPGDATRSTIQHLRSNIASFARTCYTRLRTRHKVDIPRIRQHHTSDHFQPLAALLRLLPLPPRTRSQHSCWTLALHLERSTRSKRLSANAKPKKKHDVSWLKRGSGVWPIQRCG